MHHPQQRFVALIPDGGRRAVGNDVGRFMESYRKGAEVVGDVLKACVRDSRIKIFAAWGLSEDNASKRTPAELEILNEIFRDYLDTLRRDVDTPEYEGVKVVHMGAENFLDFSVVKRIRDLARHTQMRQEKIFGLCLGYGSHDEMNRAIARHAERGCLEDWKGHLDLPLRGRIPYQHVDAIVRTGTDKPYTSAYLLPYQGPKTQERYLATPLPDTNGRMIMDQFDDALGSAKSLRHGA